MKQLEACQQRLLLILQKLRKPVAIHMQFVLIHLMIWKENLRKQENEKS